MSEHTPGPWTHEHRDRAIAIVHTHDDNKIQDIAFVDRTGNAGAMTTKMPTVSENKANVLLIAAAPELLDACKMMEGALSAVSMHVTNAYGIPAILDHARKIIAKAEGQADDN